MEYLPQVNNSAVAVWKDFRACLSADEFD